MFNQSGTQGGLGTYTVAPGAAGPYVVDVKNQLPNLSDGAAANSEVVTVVKVNSSTKYTGPAGADGAKVVVVCDADSDTISVVTSSAADVDQGLNVIKSQIAISSGVA
jgi:hypothetical protein